MAEKIILAVICIICGVILARLFTAVEVHSLKDQLLEAEKDNEDIVKDNADLVRQNDLLRKQLWELSKKKADKPTIDIPDFKDW